MTKLYYSVSQPVSCDTQVSRGILVAKTNIVLYELPNYILYRSFVGQQLQDVNFIIILQAAFLYFQFVFGIRKSSKKLVVKCW